MAMACGEQAVVRSLMFEFCKCFHVYESIEPYPVSQLKSVMNDVTQGVEQVIESHIQLGKLYCSYKDLY